MAPEVAAVTQLHTAHRTDAAPLGYRSVTCAPVREFKAAKQLRSKALLGGRCKWCIGDVGALALT